MTSTSPENDFHLPNANRDLEFDLYLDLPDNNRDLTGKRATSPEKRRADEWINKQGRRTGNARRSSTYAAADDDPRGAPRRRPQTGGFGTASEHQLMAKARGKKAEWAAIGGGWTG